uniref:Uncharacterized protein n=1 Tax=Knipowitschia caucasica TaxID=637954 RepID=A0AAV2MHK6_KNICA
MCVTLEYCKDGARSLSRAEAEIKPRNLGDSNGTLQYKTVPCPEAPRVQCPEAPRVQCVEGSSSYKDAQVFYTSLLLVLAGLYGSSGSSDVWVLPLYVCGGQLSSQAECYANTSWSPPQQPKHRVEAGLALLQYKHRLALLQYRLALLQYRLALLQHKYCLALLQYKYRLALLQYKYRLALLQYKYRLSSSPLLLLGGSSPGSSRALALINSHWRCPRTADKGPQYSPFPSPFSPALVTSQPSLSSPPRALGEAN